MEHVGKTNQGRTNQTCGFVSKLKSIPELSVDEALSVFGGNVEMYEQTVRHIVRLLPDNVRKLDALVETNLSLYAIEVHGIKGVLRHIGAYSLSDAALKLEKLSKKGDVEECSKGHPKFSKSLMQLSRNLTSVMGETTCLSKPKGDKGTLFRMLPKIEEAVLNFDGAVAMELIRTIKDYSYGEDLDEGIEDLLQALERYRFEEANEIMIRIKEGDRELPTNNGEGNGNG